MIILFVIILLLIIFVICNIKFNKINIKGKNKYIGIILVLSFMLILLIFSIIHILYYINNYKYKLVVSGIDSYIYDIEIYNNKGIKVEKKEQIMCFKAPCEPIIVDKYRIKFNYNNSDYIYNVISNMFIYETNYLYNGNKYIYIDDINKLNESQINVIKSIIYNREDILNIDISYLLKDND